MAQRHVGRLPGHCGEAQPHKAGTHRIEAVGLGVESELASLAQVGDFIFRQPLRYQTPVAVSIIVLAALVAVSLSVLERRVRGVEVVA